MVVVVGMGLLGRVLLRMDLLVAFLESLDGCRGLALVVGAVEGWMAELMSLRALVVHQGMHRGIRESHRFHLLREYRLEMVALDFVVWLRPLWE